jgi:hypothetical protein
VLGAVLAARETSSLAGGAAPAAAFVDGYSLALVIAATVLAVGVVAAPVLRGTRHSPVTVASALGTRSA